MHGTLNVICKIQEKFFNFKLLNKNMNKILCLLYNKILFIINYNENFFLIG